MDPSSNKSNDIDSGLRETWNIRPNGESCNEKSQLNTFLFYNSLPQTNVLVSVGVVTHCRMVSTEVCFLSFDATMKMDMDLDKLFGHVYIQVAFLHSDQV